MHELLVGLLCNEVTVDQEGTHGHRVRLRVHLVFIAHDEFAAWDEDHV